MQRSKDKWGIKYKADGGKSESADACCMLDQV